MDDAHARRMLQRGQGRLPHDVPLNAIERRGRRLRARRRMKRGLLATALCAVVVAGAMFAVIAPRTRPELAVRDGQRVAAGGAQHSEDDVRTGAAPTRAAAVCDAPAARPTYLPWLSDGEDVGSPEVWSGGPEDGDSVQLTWFRPDGGTAPEDAFYVALRRLTEPAAGTGGGATTNVELAGVLGRLGRGTTSGDVWMGWDTGDPTCNLIELELTTSGAYSTARAEREIERIAASLSAAATDPDGSAID